MNKAGFSRKLITTVAVIMSTYHILYISHLLEYMGIYIPVAAHRALHVAFVLLLSYLLFPFRGKVRGEVHWYNILLAVIAILVPVYYALTFEGSVLRRYLGNLSTFEIVMGWVTIVLLLEATRRAVGWAMPVLAGLLIIYTLYGHYLDGFFAHGRISPKLLLTGLLYIGEGIFGTLPGISATIIIIFVLFGTFLVASGAGEAFTKLASAVAGRYRGGPAKMVIVADIFFGMISGSSSASVAATGVITIPLMKRVGYSPNFAGAVEAVSSNGAHITPPVMGAVAFIIAEWLGISYWKVALASAVPAVFYYIALYLAIDNEAVRLKLKGLPPSELPSIKEAIKDGWYFIFPIGFLVYFLAEGFPPATAGLYGIGLTFLISMFRKKNRMGPKKLLTALRDGSVGGIYAYIACVTAGAIVQTVVITGLGPKITSLMVSASGSNLLLLGLITGVACFIFGMGLSSLAVYVVVVTLIAPAMIKLGVPDLSAHLFVYWWGITSHITPPVATAVFVACGISGGTVWGTGLTAMRLGLLTFVIPLIWLYKPGLLLMDSPYGIIIAIITTLVGVTMLAYGLSGSTLKWWQRVLLTGSAILLFTPYWIFMVAGVVIGIVIAVPFVYRWVNQKTRLVRINSG